MKRAIILSILCVFIIGSQANALEGIGSEGGEYQTPSSWSQHYSFGGRKYLGCEYRIEEWGLAASFDVTFTSSSVYLEGDFNNKEDITAQINLKWAL
jgi:hypothetical protein